MKLSVETFQNEWELQQLVSLFDDLNAIKVLEVGAWYGGTLQHWMGVGRTVVVIDDEMRNAGEWERWAALGYVDLCLLQGLSQDPEVVAKAREFGPYDFAFIDGDHNYEAVRADWENFGPLASVVAFHDIIERPGYGVSRVWSSIKSEPGTRWMEIAETVEPGNESRCGVGIVWQ